MWTGCTPSVATVPSPAASVATDPTASPAASPPATPAPPSPTATPPATTYTPEDERIAALIRAGVDTAVAQLRVLNDMDPSRLEGLFLPLDAWIADRVSEAEAATPSGCTDAAVALYLDGLDAFDDIRQTFMEWRDWGAQGHPFPRGAPREAAGILEAAVAELTARCPT